MIGFEARRVSVMEENGVLVVAVGDDPDSPVRWIVLQRTLEPTAADRQLGQDQLHVSSDANATGMYGGIVGASFSPQRLALHLTPAAAKSFGGEQVLAAELPAATFDSRVVRDALRRVLQPIPVDE